MTNELREALKNLRDVIQKEHPNAIEAIVAFKCGGVVQVKVNENIVCTSLEVRNDEQPSQ